MTSLPPLDPGELYRVLAESASDAIVTIDEDTIVLSVNPAGERLFGYSASEIVGSSLTRLMPERYRERHRAGVAHYLATRERRISWKGIQLPILTKDGREVPVEISFGEFASRGRQIFSAVMRDISERVAASAQLESQAMELEQQIEEAQTMSEELAQTNQELHEANVKLERARINLESIAEAITDGFATFDPELRFTYVNTRAASMFGVARSDLLGRDITALPHASESPFVGVLRAVIAEREPRELEAYGTIMHRWLDLRAYPAEDGGVIVYFTDSTDRRRQQDAAGFLAEASRLLASSRNYDITLKNVARAAIPRLGDWCAVDLVERNHEQQVVHVRRVVLIHDDPAKLAIAEEARRLYPPDARSGAIARALSGQSILVPSVTDEMLVNGTRDARHLALFRSLGLASLMVVPLSVAGHVLGVLTFCNGDARRRFDEVDLRLAEDLAGRAANAVEHARLLEKAEAANAAKSEFLRTVSHEFRQPLNAIGGLLQLWELGLRGALTDQQQQDLERIKRNQLQLATLIEDLLSFARLEVGKLEVRHEEVRIAPVLEGLSIAIGGEVETKGIEYRSVPPDASLTVVGDADRLHQVLTNLVTNAIKATSRGGRVEVSCVDGGDTVQIRVRDTGAGIPEDQLEAIFTPFVQLGRALNQPKEGAGLGLAISRGLVEAMGGTLTVESTVGEGSTFTISLEASKR